MNIFFDPSECSPFLHVFLGVARLGISDSGALGNFRPRPGSKHPGHGGGVDVDAYVYGDGARKEAHFGELLTGEEEEEDAILWEAHRNHGVHGVNIPTGEESGGADTDGRRRAQSSPQRFLDVDKRDRSSPMFDSGSSGRGEKADSQDDDDDDEVLSEDDFAPLPRMCSAPNMMPKEKSSVQGDSRAKGGHSRMHTTDVGDQLLGSDRFVEKPPTHQVRYEEEGTYTNYSARTSTLAGRTISWVASNRRSSLPSITPNASELSVSVPPLPCWWIQLPSWEVLTLTGGLHVPCELGLSRSTIPTLVSPPMCWLLNSNASNENW